VTRDVLEKYYRKEMGSLVDHRAGEWPAEVIEDVSRCDAPLSADSLLSDLGRPKPLCVSLPKEKESRLHNAWQSCHRGFCTCGGLGAARKRFLRLWGFILLSGYGDSEQELSRPGFSGT
jgi:hypothetical protein